MKRHGVTKGLVVYVSAPSGEHRRQLIPIVAHSQYFG
jgi:hypothetical protein